MVDGIGTNAYSYGTAGEVLREARLRAGLRLGMAACGQMTR